MSSVADKLLGAKFEEVPIADIRHSDRHCYVREGHGGQPVETWPILSFFRRYLAGDRENAAADFESWYREQFERYRDVPKSLGGMKNGSLARLVDSFGRNAGQLGERLAAEEMQRTLAEAVAARVRQRFELVESIVESGYRPEKRDPILGIRRGREVVLVRGHHRVAVLAALGHVECPQILTFPSRKHFRIWSWARAMSRIVARRLTGAGQRPWRG